MEGKRRSFHVPEELVLDILLRLPVKSLSRFKCVSKNWYDLIESTSFVEQHCGHESNRERLLICLGKETIMPTPDIDDDDGEEEEEIIIGPWIPLPGIDDQEQLDDDYAEYLYYRELVLDRENDERLHRRQAKRPDVVYSYKCALYVDESFSEYEDPAHLQINPDEGDTRVFWPLNGVFCVASRFPCGPMALLNPALRQFKPLPLVEHVDPADRHKCINELGVGLDPLTGEYKLVLIIQLLGRNMNIMGRQINKCIVQVCNSDSDSWKVVDDVDLTCLSRPACGSLCNTYLNGSYYWFLHPQEFTDPVAILAFDMGTDRFRTIQVTGHDPESPCQGFLALSGDTLALLKYDGFDHNGARFINVWKMENEGCWIKSLRVGPLQGIFARPLCFWTKDELLYESLPTFLAQCNVSTGESKTFQAKMTDQGRFTRWIYAYKESLVSIKGKAGKCKLWDPSSDFVKDFFKDQSYLPNFQIPREIELF